MFCCSVHVDRLEKKEKKWGRWMVEGLITRPSPTIEKKTKQNDNISEGKQKYLMGDFFFLQWFTLHTKRT